MKPEWRPGWSRAHEGRGVVDPEVHEIFAGDRPAVEVIRVDDLGG